MSVTDVLTLPAQPTVGKVRLVALPGDGQTSPFSRWDVFLQVAGDASGGFARSTVNLDPTYVSLVDYVRCYIDATAGASAFMIDIFNSSEEAAALAGEGSFSDVTSGTNRNSAVWFPPNMPLLKVPGSDVDPNVRCMMDNPGVGQQLQVFMRILNWHALAKENTPNEFFVAALTPRN